MIIYGYNSSVIASHKEPHLKCPKCNVQHTIHFYSVGKYATLFWIPMFPIGTKTTAICENCQAEISKKQFPSNFSLALQKLKDSRRRPIWHYSGLGIVAILVTLFYFNDQQHKKDVLTYIEAPQKGDIYDVKLDDGDYTLYAVQSVTKDSVFVYMNDYKTNYKTGLSDIDRSENYASDIFGFSKSDIKTLFETKHIIDVKRD